MDPLGPSRTTHAVVTGGAGFIGSHLSTRLLALGQRVTVLTRHTEAPRARQLAAQGARVIPYDVASSAASPWLEGLGPVHYVYHFAADVAVKGPGVWKTNVEGTQRALALADTLSAPYFIYASSIEAQGPGSADDGLLSETDPARPVSDYGASKVKAEALVDDWNRPPQRHALTLRIGNIHGPGSAWMLESALMTLLGVASIRSVWDRLRHRLFQPLYVDDLIDGILRAVGQRLTGLYNITGAESVSVERYLETLCELIGMADRLDEIRTQATMTSPTPVAPDFAYFLMGDEARRHRTYDNRKLRSCVGDYSRWSVARGLASTLRWFHESDRLAALLHVVQRQRGVPCT